jgi:hypothetical protein
MKILPFFTVSDPRIADSTINLPSFSNSKTPFVAPAFLTTIVNRELHSCSTSVIELSSCDELITASNYWHFYSIGNVTSKSISLEDKKEVSLCLLVAMVMAPFSLSTVEISLFRPCD